MKKCSRCGIEKEESEFNAHKRYADGLNCWCKSCVKEYSAIHYRTNNDKYREYQREHRLEGRVRNRTWHNKKRERLNGYKTDCVKCGDSRRYLIDFHHIDPSTKYGNLSNMCLSELDVVLEAEVSKCVCLCRNCHFEFHYIYGNNPHEPVKALAEYLEVNEDAFQL